MRGFMLLNLLKLGGFTSSLMQTRVPKPNKLVCYSSVKVWLQFCYKGFSLAKGECAC